MANYSDLTLQDARKLIPDAASAWVKANVAYRDGDHWQRGMGWVGPQPDKRDTVTWGNMRKMFVSRQVIGELVTRHVNAVLGDRPQWMIQVTRPLDEGEKPSAAEQAQIDMAKSILEGFWDNRKAVKPEYDELITPYDAVTHAVSNALYLRRGVLRLFIPSRFLDEQGQIPQRDIEQALDVVFLQSLEPTEATVSLDRVRMEQVGIYLYKVDGQEGAELVYLDEETSPDDENRLTVFKAMNRPKANDGNSTEEMAALDIDQQLTMFEVSLPLLITEQVRSLQAQLNMTLTMLGRNTVQAGFLERVFLNAQPPYETKIDDETGELIRIDGDLKLGAGTANFVSGLEITDLTGNKSYTTPAVVYRDPVSPETFARSEAILYAGLLTEAKQVHALIGGDAAASGESRIQARADFYNSVLPTARQVETAVTWLLQTVLKMAAVIAGQPDLFTGLSVYTQARVNTGPLTSDERRVIVEMVEKNIISHKTALGMLQISDAEAELEQISTEREAKSERDNASLATGILRARAQMQSGQASNGLELGQQQTTNSPKPAPGPAQVTTQETNQAE